MSELRDCWELTSFELEQFQTNKDCVRQEREGLKRRTAPQWMLTFNPNQINISNTNIDFRMTFIEVY